MDDDTFEAAKETCMVLGGKLSDVRHRQLVCYSSSRDLETDINNNIMKLSFDQKDFSSLDLHHVRSNTPCKELSPTPLDKHRSREPSPFRMPPLKLSSGTATPGGGQVQDPHAYFSRPESSQSIYGGRGGPGNKPLDLDTFRAAMEAKQMTDDSPPQRRPPQPAQLSKSTSGNIVLRSASGVVLCRSDGTETGTTGAVFDQERPGSAMSDMSINIPDLASHTSRPSSRLGDEVSAAFDHFSEAPINYSDREVQQEISRKMILQEDTDKFYREKRTAAEEKERAEAVAELQKLEDMKQQKELKLTKEKHAFETKQKLEEDKRKQEEAAHKVAQEEAARKKKEDEVKLRKQKEAEEKALEEAKRKEERRMAREKEEQEKKKAREEAKRKEEEIQRFKKEKEEQAKLKAQEEAKKKEEEMRLKREKKAQAKQKLLDDAKKKEEEVAAKKKEEELLKKKKEEEILAAKRKEEENLKMKKEEELLAKRKEIELQQKEAQVEPSETPQLGKMKRRTSSTEDKRGGSRAESPVSILKTGGKGSRDSSKDRRTMSESEDIPVGKPLSRTGSLKKSSSFNKNKSLSEKKKISFDDDVDGEPISQAKALFAAIADTSLEAGRSRVREKTGAGDVYNRAEPAEWDPDMDPDNEDELMIILDTPETSKAEDLPLKSRSQSRSGDRSTGFSHLDEFEKRLAEMQDDLEDDESKASKEPIYAKITKKERLTDDGYFINNKDEDLPDFEADEDVGSEYSRKKVSFAQSEERFEFEVQKKETAFRSFTKFLAKELPLNFKRDPSLDARLSAAEGPLDDCLEKENVPPPPVAPRRSRSRSKQRSVSLQRPSSQQSQNIVLGARSQSLSRTGDTGDNSARSFLSAMTGGLSSRVSRPGSRQSSGDRSSLQSWSGLDTEDQSYASASDMDNSLLGQLKRLKPKPKQVQQADFDELFARGMAMSAEMETEDATDAGQVVKKRDKRDKEPPALTLTTEKVKHDNGIGYAEKVRSYLDDQAKAEMLESEDGGHVSRGRKKHRTKGSRSASEAGLAKQKSVEERKRSREYSKPEDIKLSPTVKRDLFTGEIISDPKSNTIPLMSNGHLESKKPEPTILSIPQSSRVTAIHNRHTQGLAPSPGKSFLDATTGQEVFGASIEEDNPMLTNKLNKTEKLSNGQSNIPIPMNSAYDAYDTVTASGRKKSSNTSVPTPLPKPKEEPADKGIPTKLKPDRLMANEEFYEQLRDSMKEVEVSREFESTQEDPESYLKYSHHLGRAEFGTLKKRTSTRPSAATSRDPSGDRINSQRSGI